MKKRPELSKYMTFVCLFIAVSSRVTLGQPISEPLANAVFPIPARDGDIRIPDQNDTYTVFTGLWSSTGAHYVIEDYPVPTHTDAVAFDGISERINDYLPSASSVQRTVAERIDFDSPLPGQATLVITITGVLPSGGPGDLWPSNYGLSNGDVSLGLPLPSQLGGYHPLTWDGLSTVPVVSGSIRWRSDGIFVTPRNLPISTFFDNGNWDGILQIAVSNVGSGPAVTDAIELSIVTSKVPEMRSSIPLLIGAVVLSRRCPRFLQSA